MQPCTATDHRPPPPPPHQPPTQIPMIKDKDSNEPTVRACSQRGVLIMCLFISICRLMDKLGHYSRIGLNDRSGHDLCRVPLPKVVGSVRRCVPALVLLSARAILNLGHRLVTLPILYSRTPLFAYIVCWCTSHSIFSLAPGLQLRVPFGTCLSLFPSSSSSSSSPPLPTPPSLSVMCRFLTTRTDRASAGSRNGPNERVS